MPSISLPSAAAISAGAALAGAATEAVGTIAQGHAASSEASYQAQVARNNAVMAQQKAAYSTEAGEAQAQEKSLQNAGQLGEIKTAQAANDIDVNSGSAVNVQESQRELGEYGSETTLNNALLQAYGYQTEATGFQATAGLEQTEASQAPIGAALSATGGLLSNASSVGTNWLKLNSPTAQATGDW